MNSVPVCDSEHVPLEPFPREHLQIPIPQLLDAAAHRYADRKPICGADGSFTYRDTRDLIDRVAHAILEASVAPGDRVVLLFGHRGTAFAAALGVVKSGAIAVPLTRQRRLTDAIGSPIGLRCSAIHC